MIIIIIGKKLPFIDYLLYTGHCLILLWCSYCHLTLEKVELEMVEPEFSPDLPGSQAVLWTPYHPASMPCYFTWYNCCLNRGQGHFYPERGSKVYYTLERMILCADIPIPCSLAKPWNLATCCNKRDFLFAINSSLSPKDTKLISRMFRLCGADIIGFAWKHRIFGTPFMFS